MEERREQKTIEGFGRIFKPRYTRKSADGSLGIEHTTTGGKFFSKGHEKTGRASRIRYGNRATRNRAGLIRGRGRA